MRKNADSRKNKSEYDEKYSNEYKDHDRTESLFMSIRLVNAKEEKKKRKRREKKASLRAYQSSRERNIFPDDD